MNYVSRVHLRRKCSETERKLNATRKLFSPSSILHRAGEASIETCAPRPFQTNQSRDAESHPSRAQFVPCGECRSDPGAIAWPAPA